MWDSAWGRVPEFLQLDRVSLQLDRRSVYLRHGDFCDSRNGKLFQHGKLRRGGAIAVRRVHGQFVELRRKLESASRSSVICPASQLRITRSTARRLVDFMA